MNLGERDTALRLYTEALVIEHTSLGDTSGSNVDVVCDELNKYEDALRVYANCRLNKRVSIIDGQI
jgi:hypothetical protein